MKNEAVKRGIKLGAYIVRDFDDDYLEHYGFVVYSKGQWAKVSETKTIQEAEELLKELGHNFKIV